MAQRVITVLACDKCGREEGNEPPEVKSHTITVDGKSVAVDTCDDCWPAEVDELLAAGRKVTRKKAGAS